MSNSSNSSRKCTVFLPDDRKLELTLQNKLTGRELLDIVATHFNLKEKEYFGITYKSDGHDAWLQNDKRVVDHDVAKKPSTKLEFTFAVKFYAESVAMLKHAVTVELFFLHLKSTVYKGQLRVDAPTSFRLAAHALQVIIGDYVEDEQAVAQLHKLPLLPSKVTRDTPQPECEVAVLDNYKKLKGTTKGKAILSYITCIEALPAYGIHYYKVKDKSGLPWFVGISYKGISQFDVHDKTSPIKTFNWRQLENLYFREKKFSIEVGAEKVGGKVPSSIDPARKKSGDGGGVRVFAWYGSPTLIKSIWLMSIAQHHYYLNRKQSKAKLQSTNSLLGLDRDLSSGNRSLIQGGSKQETMTRKQIKDVDVTVKKGSKEESPELRAAKREMTQALKTRRVELEDRLYDKIQEMKSICLLEAEYTGKLPLDFVRYLDPNEKVPKNLKRVGAEFKVKLRGKDKTGEREFPASVTAASSSSSGFSSDATGAAGDELAALETEFEILTQIMNAAKKLATDPGTRTRTRHRRRASYKKTVHKLQLVEDKINVLRTRCGKKPSERMSMLLIGDELAGLNFADTDLTDVGIGLLDTTGSERSSLSDGGGLATEDEVSLSSGGLSTHSTPAPTQHRIAPPPPPHPSSVMLERRKLMTDATSSHDVRRSQTPPADFRPDASPTAHYAAGTPPPRRPSPASSSPEIVTTRIWTTLKWETPAPRTTRGWNESALDVGIDNGTSRDNQELAVREKGSNERVMRAGTGGGRRGSNGTRLLPPCNANTNHNNHKSAGDDATDDDTTLIRRHHLTRETSDDALSQLSTKSSPPSRPPADRATPPTAAAPIRDQQQPTRKRSSSLTETSHRRPPPPASLPLGAGLSRQQQLQPPSPALDTYNVPQALTIASPKLMTPDTPLTPLQQSLQPTVFDTNVNIRTKYQQHLVAGSKQQQRSFALSNQPHPAVGPYHHLAFYQGGYDALYCPPAPGFAPSGYAPLPEYPSAQVRTPPQLSYVDMVPKSAGADEVEEEEVFRSDQERDSDLESNVDWAPSLHEYSSRASVAESCNAQSKKEDILRLLEDHINLKRSSSSASSSHQPPAHHHHSAAIQRKIREKFIRAATYDQLNKHRIKSRHPSDEHTWANYQKKLLERESDMTASKRSSPVLDPPPRAPTSVFQHQPPPPAPAESSLLHVPDPTAPSPMLYKTQRIARQTSKQPATYYALTTRGVDRSAQLSSWQHQPPAAQPPYGGEKRRVAQRRFRPGPPPDLDSRVFHPPESWSPGECSVVDQTVVFSSAVDRSRSAAHQTTPPQDGADAEELAANRSVVDRTSQQKPDYSYQQHSFPPPPAYHYTSRHSLDQLTRPSRVIADRTGGYRLAPDRSTVQLQTSTGYQPYRRKQAASAEDLLWTAAAADGSQGTLV